MDVQRWLKRLCLREAPSAPLETAPLSFNEMERHLNDGALALFERYRQELLDQTSLYLVPAVWGEHPNGDLDPVQRDIHRTVAPLVNELRERLVPGGDGTGQAEGVEYLLKGLFLYKLAYMIQYYQNCRNHVNTVSGAAGNLLERLEPAGRA